MKRCVHVSLCALLMLLLIGSQAVADSELDYVKQAIAAKGAKWEAGETSVSKLSKEERKMKLGLDKSKMPDAPMAALSGDVTGLSPTLDWRSYNGGGWVTGVRDQGQCGSCWAFAAAAALESSVLIKNGMPGVELNLAEQILLSCSTAGTCSGGSVTTASNYIQSTGLPPETCYPYTTSNGTCSSACANWQTSAYKISSWSYVATTAPTVDAIKNALNTYGPLVTTMDVYYDFFYYAGGVYRYSTGTYQGGHAILIVGYDDVNQCFICKNSWGAGWGEGGFFRISYAEVGGTADFGDYTIAYLNGATPPPPDPPPPSNTCTYALSPTGTTHAATGGSGTISVTTGSACAWTVSEGVSWITITSATSGTGSGRVTYAVEQNTGKNARNSSITVGGQLHSVKQSGTKLK